MLFRNRASSPRGVRARGTVVVPLPATDGNDTFLLDTAFFIGLRLGYPRLMVSLPEHLAQGPVGKKQVSRDMIDTEHRDHVLDVATEVFAKRGYPATTVDHIVSAARIGVGRFYSLFDGKEDCFLQAYERNLATGRARVEESIPGGALGRSSPAPRCRASST